MTDRKANQRALRAFAEGLVDVDQVKGVQADIRDNDPALWRVFQQISGMLTKDKGSTLRIHHEIGKVLQQVKDDENNVRHVYGQDAYDKILRAFPDGRKLLSQCYKFSKEYTDQDVAYILGLKGPVETFMISWTHVARVLESCSTKEEALGYLKKAVDEALSAEKMRELILAAKRQSTAAGQPVATHGRTFAKPTGPNALLTRIQKLLKQLKEQYVGVIAENLAVLNMMTSTAELMDQLSVAEEITMLLQGDNETIGCLEILRILNTEVGRASDVYRKRIATSQIGGQDDKTAATFTRPTEDIADDPDSIVAAAMGEVA